MDLATRCEYFLPCSMDIMDSKVTNTVKLSIFYLIPLRASSSRCNEAFSLAVVLFRRFNKIISFISYFFKKLKSS